MRSASWASDTGATRRNLLLRRGGSGTFLRSAETWTSKLGKKKDWREMRRAARAEGTCKPEPQRWQL